MKVHAYVLAGDPTWLIPSVSAYYAFIDKLVVAYDVDGRGWTGSSIRVDECVDTLRSIDHAGKIEWVTGAFTARAGEGFLDAETRQRRVALEHAAREADWILQIDTDEVLPRWEPLQNLLEEADRRQCQAVEWPMRVLYRSLPSGRCLEVVTHDAKPHFEFPGPVALRSGASLEHCRHASVPFLRAVVLGDDYSLQVQGLPVAGEHRTEIVVPTDAIWHNSWARSPAVVRAKISAWGHYQGARTWVYYYSKWLPAPLTWRVMRNFHPLYPRLWPRLKVSADLPSSLS